MGLFENLLGKITGDDEPEMPGYGGYVPDENDTSYVQRDPRTITSDNSYTHNRPSPASVNTNVSTTLGSAIEMKVVKPDRFEAVGPIADLLLGGNTVLLNLEDTNKETARRLIDFLTGVAYAIEGDLKKIANCTYVITPNNVRVSDAENTADEARPAATGEIF